MTIDEDVAEYLLMSVSPGSVMFESNQTARGVENLGIAAAGMPRVHWYAVLFRGLQDQQSWLYLWSRLYAIAASNPSRPVRRKASELASLVLAEDATGNILANTGTAPHLLGLSRSQYYRDCRHAHLAMRARLDTWARAGFAHLTSRIKGKGR